MIDCWQGSRTAVSIFTKEQVFSDIREISYLPYKSCVLVWWVAVKA